jgi:hypothetical protein
LCEAVSLSDWKKIATQAVEQAKEGDHQARTWLGRYLIGEPQLGENEANNEAAELLEQRLAVIESHLRPLGLVDDRYPTEELARIAAKRLIDLDGDRIVARSVGTDDSAANSAKRQQNHSANSAARDA